MKKILLLLFVLGMSSQIFAQLSTKQVVGKWKYTVTSDQGDLTGTLNFVEKEGKLTGEVWSDDGNSFPLTKVELKENEVLYFELEPNYELYKVTLKIEAEIFKGTVVTGQGDFNITAEKKE